jgi:hypothetical protein
MPCTPDVDLQRAAAVFGSDTIKRVKMRPPTVTAVESNG